MPRIGRLVEHSRITLRAAVSCGVNTESRLRQRQVHARAMECHSAAVLPNQFPGDSVIYTFFVYSFPICLLTTCCNASISLAAALGASQARHSTTERWGNGERYKIYSQKALSFLPPIPLSYFQLLILFRLPHS